MAEQRVPDPVINASRKGGLEIYGPGTDGDVTVISNIILNRDMYYNNLTVAANCSIDTNGYRIFVKNTLNMLDSTSVIGRLANTGTTGTLIGGAISGIKASDTLGGSGGLNPGENIFAETEFYNFSQAIVGVKFDAAQNRIRVLMGGSGGLPGNQGTKGADGTASGAGAGSPGTAGSPGNRPGFENTVGAPGGRGYTGATGAPGTVGSGGIGGDGGLGGLGGIGGGVVVVSARFIVGSGIIRADGQSPLPPEDGQPGSPGSAGTPGAPGDAGAKAPDFFQYSRTVVNANAYNYAQPASQTFNTNYGFTTVPDSRTVQNVYTRQQSRTVPSPGNSYYIPSSGGNAVYRTVFAFNPGRVTSAFNAGRTVRTPRGSFFQPGNIYYRYIDGNPYSYQAVQRYNPFTPGRTAFNSPFTFTQTNTVTNYGFSQQPFTFTYQNVQPGRTVQFFNSVFVPASETFIPSAYYTGGAGGAGGPGGAGGTVTAGLPGSPGSTGYAGGGGVVLLITENDIPGLIDVRAAAGTGGGGLATAGTVIIIKNEEDNK